MLCITLSSLKEIFANKFIHFSTLQATQRLSGLFGARRENAAVRQGAILDKPPMALRSLLIEKLTEMEENREGRMGKNNFQVFLSFL